MAVIYCSSCGCKHEYTSSKPNFCSKCGGSIASFGGGQIAAAKSTEDENPNVKEDLSVLNLDKLSAKISFSGGNKTSIERLFEDPLNPENLPKPRVASNYSKENKREYFKRSMDECSTIERKGVSIEVEE